MEPKAAIELSKPQFRLKPDGVANFLLLRSRFPPDYPNPSQSWARRAGIGMRPGPPFVTQRVQADSIWARKNHIRAPSLVIGPATVFSGDNSIHNYELRFED